MARLKGYQRELHVTEYFGKAPNNFIRIYSDRIMDSFGGRISHPRESDDSEFGPQHLRLNDSESMRRWVEGCTSGTGFQEAVELGENYGIVLPTKGVQRPYFTNEAGITVTEGEMGVRNKDVPKYLTKALALEMEVAQYIRSDEGARLGQFLINKGYSADQIDEVVVQDKPRGALYQVSRKKKGSGRLHRITDNYLGIEYTADNHKLNVTDANNLFLAEEIAHLFRSKGVGGKKEEIRTKSDLLEFYTIRLKEARTVEDKEKYSTLVAIMEDDIATIDRYDQLYDEIRDMAEEDTPRNELRRGARIDDLVDDALGVEDGEEDDDEEEGAED